MDFPSKRLDDDEEFAPNTALLHNSTIFQPHNTSNLILERSDRNPFYNNKDSINKKRNS